MQIRVKITSGNVANSHLYITDLLRAGMIPQESIGEPSRRGKPGEPIRLDLEGFPEPVYSDVPRESKNDEPRHFFRDRSWVQLFLGRHGLKAGDEVVFEQLGPRHFRVSPSVGGASGTSDANGNDESDAAMSELGTAGRGRPSDGMFGVKLIYPDHLRFSHLCGTFPSGDPRVPLMNFKNTPRNLKAAAAIPVGHRALVFTKQHIVWAIEFTGGIDDGSMLAAHGVEPNWPSAEWTVHRPIRFLARMNTKWDDYHLGMHRHEIQARSGVDRRSYGNGHFYISAEEYQRMFEAIPWDWRAGDPDMPPPTDSPARIATPDCPSRSEPFIALPIDDSDSLLTLVRSVAGTPERNMEDAVKELLVRLGHPRGAVRFQIGHIDVALDGADGKPLFVFEVKRSLASANTRKDALRQGFDYANRVGARYVVISDADRYVIYDRSRGLDHASMLCGEFQLTAFRPCDIETLAILRPCP